MVRLQSHRDGNFTSAHLSIFPCKTVQEAAEKGSRSYTVNSTYVIVGDAEEAWCMPGNLEHYMRKELEPKMRFNPPWRFKDMMLGRIPIPLEYYFPEEDIKQVGWVDYAHEDGTVYSGTYNGGGFDYVNEFKVPEALKGCLVECADHDDVSAASNCADMSPAELKEMDVIAKRTAWLFQVAAMRQRATDEDINKALATPEQKENMLKFFGEGNTLPVLSYPLRFPPPVLAD